MWSMSPSSHASSPSAVVRALAARSRARRARARRARVARSLGAGVAAAAVMSAYMLGAESRAAIGVAPQVRIVRRLRPRWTAERTAVAATALHVAIGATGGVLSAVLARPTRPSSLVVALSLWAVGYEVVAPLLRVLPPAHRDRTRTTELLRAHLVYAAALAGLRHIR